MPDISKDAPAVGWVVAYPDYRGGVRVALLRDSYKPTRGEGTTISVDARFYKVTDPADMDLSLDEIKAKFIKAEDFSTPETQIELIKVEPIFSMGDEIERALTKNLAERRKAPVPEVDKRWRNGTQKGADDKGHL